MAVDTGRVLCEVHDNRASVTLSHPERLNAITIKMWYELAHVFQTLSAETDIRCVIVQGDGNHFASGADINEFPDYRLSIEGVDHYHNNLLAPALAAMAHCPHPIIARIQGVCVGGGLEIASQCDLRIAAADARFGVPIGQLGFPMAPAEMQTLLNLVGPATTLELLLEGRIIDADEALAKGLVTRVVSVDALDDAINESVSNICRGAPLAAQINKETVRRLVSNPTALTRGELHQLFRYADTHDHHEGISAFLDGRAPKFSGE